jgi:hypothetical protein
MLFWCEKQVRRAIMRRIAAFVVSLGAAGTMATGASAATIGLTEVSPIDALSASVLSVSITGSGFPNTTIGGDMTVSWDPAVLDFQSFTRDLIWPNGSLVDPDGSDGSISFTLASNDFDQGPAFPIGDLTYAVIGPAGSFSPIDFESGGDGWLALGQDLESVTVSYEDASVNVVPLPAAGWLMLGGLGVLIGALRQRSSLIR